MITGIMMTASETAPAKALYCRNGSTRSVYTKIPMRIEGTPTITSAANRMVRAERRLLNSLT